MARPIRTLCIHEDGFSPVEWIGVSALVCSMIIVIWTAFYGSPGKALKEVVQAQITAYAHGFEGGLTTTGPTGCTVSFQPAGDSQNESYRSDQIACQDAYTQE